MIDRAVAHRCVVFITMAVAFGVSACGRDGAERISAAGALPTDATYDEARSEVREVRDDEGGLGAVVCSAQNWGASEVRELTDVAALSANQFIYPGALVQGRGFADGLFTPVTIARAPGEIYLTGLTLAPNAAYRRTVAPVRGDTVAQAIADILSTEVEGTAADLSYSIDQVYSAEQMQFDLHADGRSLNASFAADLGVDEERRRSYVLLRFVQRYFDVVFVDPAAATDVFADGVRYRDPERQIGPGNPPLYASKVSYGRMILLLAESEHSARDVEAALRGAYQGALASVQAESGFTYGEVMSNTSVRYYVKGGDAGAAVRPIAASTAEGMFDAVRDFIASEADARFSAATPGAPIAYSLHYLHDRSPARMSYAVDYVRQDCATVSGPPTRAHAFRLDLNNIEDDVHVYWNGELIEHHDADATSVRSRSYDLTSRLTGGDDRVRVHLGNYGCWGTRLDGALYRDGVQVDTQTFAAGHGLDCNYSRCWRWTVNGPTGAHSFEERNRFTCEALD